VKLGEEHRFKVSENRVLRRITDLKRGKLNDTAENCIMQNVIFCTLPSLYIIRIIKSRRIRRTGHVAYMEEMINTYVFFGKPTEKNTWKT
jgi:hypothetical protein